MMLLCLRCSSNNIHPQLVARTSTPQGRVYACMHCMHACICDRGTVAARLRWVFTWSPAFRRCREVQTKKEPVRGFVWRREGSCPGREALALYFSHRRIAVIAVTGMVR